MTMVKGGETPLNIRPNFPDEIGTLSWGEITPSPLCIYPSTYLFTLLGLALPRLTPKFVTLKGYFMNINLMPRPEIE